MSKADLRRPAAAIAIAAGLGLTAIGLGAGAASATPPVPHTGPVPWVQDDDHDGPSRGHWKHGDDWGPGQWRGPVGWPVPVGCVSATDPSGLVAGTFCV